MFKMPVKFPLWARWVAVDKFGVLVCFENKPEIFEGSLWHAKGRNKDLVQFCGQHFSGWKKSLNELHLGTDRDLLKK
jgi:hypothetical protein